MNRASQQSLAPIKDQFAAPETLVPPGVKGFLEEFPLGRLGLRAGRKILQFLRKSRDPLWRRIWISRIGLPIRNAILFNRPVKVSLDGIPVLLSPQGSTAGDIWAGVRCESHEVSFILSVLKPGMIFFDVGANAGLFTISAAKKIGGKGVFSFEPCSSTCDLLMRNLQLNGLADVSVVRMALGDSVGEAVLQINARGKDGLNTLGKASHPDSKVVGQEGVRITTADNFYERTEYFSRRCNESGYRGRGAHVVSRCAQFADALGRTRHPL